ncbi:Retrovirus-related Pol polyprotein from transposon RE1 [Vitis vinifera]|uniref:Retrovirus-related Pol polyprotein from transposon RE1 n=1 Tax=Vitis vinifera TaxID=29760 RepID=A0A438ID31_VITVI|nr:Retrovirus-related Pol polyprotein from transposon RE1 [Vitis vinifera]
MEIARRMLFEKKLPKLLWVEAVSTLNLKVFGSLSYLPVPSIKRGKLDERAKKESTSIEDPLDVEATSNTPVLKVRPLSDVYERCNLVHAEPTCYTEAARFPEWIEAMKAEIDVFITKFNSDGSIFKYKARLVVKGFAQVAGVDYGDTFAPVARHDTIRLLLALAGQMGWKVYHLDVKSAFLNGILLEEIYVQQPKSFKVTGHEQKVYKLHKALYGLKQAPRAWYSRIDSHLIQLGFRRSENEATLYLKQNEDGLQLVVLVYVDDMLVIGSNVRLLAEFKMEMQDVFEMSDLGIMNYFLGIEIYQCSSGIFISQRKYVVDILKKFKLESCKEVAILLAQNEKISKNDGEKLEEPSAYRSLVGSLLYLTTTRPDLMFPTGLLSRFMSSPSNVHMGVAKKVLKYVKGSIDDMKSTSGYVFTIGLGVICWNSRKQEVVAQSATETEYISLEATANQGIWLRKLLADLGQEQSSPTELYCDNKSTIVITQNPVQHGRTKHINVKFHSIREAEKNSLVKLHYCSTDVQLADIMTKTLPKSRLEFLRLKLGMSRANLKELDGLAVLISTFEQLEGWSGDPCLPSDTIWQWLNCIGNDPPRVTSLNLSGYGLDGSLPDFSQMQALIPLGGKRSDED